jgi:DNA-binding NtrC family response regulator
MTVKALFGAGGSPAVLGGTFGHPAERGRVRDEGGMSAVQVAAAAERPTVLLVEDEVLIRLMVADELRGQGLQVIEASNADEALTILESSLPIHLLFTDVRMPGRMDGVALAKLAQARFPRLKLIIASSREPEEPSRPPAHAFISKPYDLNKVIEQVERILAQTDNDR